MLRVVRSPEGVVAMDPTGRMPGRGAYLCRDAACWELARRKRSLEHALKVAIPDDIIPDIELDQPQGGAHGPK